MTITIQDYGWCCNDCLFYLANGETPEHMTEDETAEWLAGIEQNLGEWHVDLGGKHDDDCPNMRDGEWVGDTDCYCEQIDFSWSACDVCRSHLGGSRDAVFFYTLEG